MTTIERFELPRGIVPVVQTPFTDDGSIDWGSLERLIEQTISAGAAGFLAPAVASEVAYLSIEERTQLVQFLAKQLRNRTPLIVGASSDDPAQCAEMATIAERSGAAAWLIAVPQSLYQEPDQVVPFFQRACGACRLPLIIQDLQFGGPGLPVAVIGSLRDALPTLRGIKIETVPAGSKYSAVRTSLGTDFYVAGGWAVPQMIEALDRGVDAMIPECSMVRVYDSIYRLYLAGRRSEAVRLFRSLLPVLAFTNQELTISIAFFKRLLVRKGFFATPKMRIPGFAWDSYSERIADELIERYLELESETARSDLAASSGKTGLI